MFPELAFILGGFLVGTVVGVSGVSGGALMTPLLVLNFGIAPHLAVGTDLLFAAVTKTAGMLVHGCRGTVDWQVFRRLSCGSLPAALLTVACLYEYRSPVADQTLIVHAIGLTIVVTATALLYRPMNDRLEQSRRTGDPTACNRFLGLYMVLAGVLLGVMVSLTSVGAGALGATILVFLYPTRLKPAALVGTDIAHAIAD